MPCFTSSNRLFGTRRRVPAAHAWPLFIKAMTRADGIALSSAASSSRMVGDLPPSSRVTRFIVFALSRMIVSPYGYRTCERDLRYVGIAHELGADNIAETRDHIQEALR